jgi:hypothetical protein
VIVKMLYRPKTGAPHPLASRVIGILSGQNFRNTPRPHEPTVTVCLRCPYSYSRVAFSDTFSTLSEMLGGITVYPSACP